jgi:2-aminoadipate transaminase
LRLIRSPYSPNVLIILPVSTSYKERLGALERETGVSLIEQIVAAIERAIADGEVMPGDKLPPTRELAGLAGVNHLTAARAYRRLAERGAVVSRVGAGTFVRGAAAIAQEEPLSGRPASTAWQHYALPEADGTYTDSILLDLFRSSAEPGDDLIPLITGYPSEALFPSAELAELSARVAAEVGPRSWQYAPPEGVPELRAALAELGAADGLADGPESVIVTTGARQALLLVARAIVTPGDVVACESPSFAGVVSALRAAGAQVLPVPSGEDGLDVDALEVLLRRHEVKLLTLQPRLQNPTGRDLSPERRERLIELARRHGFFVVEDGIYSPLRFEGADHGPLRPLAPEHVIYVHSLSKTVSSGLRTGWAVASGPVLERIAQQKRNDDMTSATLPQLIAARFLAGDGWERQRRRAIGFHRVRRDAMLEAIDEFLEGVAAPVHRPLGGGHVWVGLHEPLEERRLYAEAVRHGVNFMPAGASMPERPTETLMRLSYSYLDPAQLREGVRRLGGAIRALRRAERPARQALPIA